MFEWFMRLFSDQFVERRYVAAGAEFGDAVSYIYVGECHGFMKMCCCWAKWEKEYARRGYRTVSIDDLIDHGGYGKPLHNIGVKRNVDEKPIFHAEMYQRMYTGKVKPVINLIELLKPSAKSQTETYVLPSTMDKNREKE